jgi:haloalkane dehalogenase
MEQRHVEAQLCVLPDQRLGFLIGAQREFCRAWPNQSAVTVKGAHFLPEGSPEVVGSDTASLVAKVLAGPIRSRPAGRIDRR